MNALQHYVFPNRITRNIIDRDFTSMFKGNSKRDSVDVELLLRDILVSPAGRLSGSVCSEWPRRWKLFLCHSLLSVKLPFIYIQKHVLSK